ncbi:tetraacyldisaccharide 4'-kinase, partial [Anaerofustis stercorihominis]
MIKQQPVHINKWLLPFSWLYGLIVFFRNKFFDWGILKQEEFDVPVI